MTQCSGHNCNCACEISGAGKKNMENAEQNGGYRKSVLYLQGLDCANCAAELEKRIASGPGVASVEVSFATSRVTVEHNTDINKIIKEINRAGYSADTGRTPAERAPFYKNTGMLLTVFSGLLLAAGIVFSFLSVPVMFKDYLLLGAVIAGGVFVAVRAFYSLKSLQVDMNVLMIVAVTGAVILGEWTEAAAVVFLFSLGNILQEYSMEKTRASIRELMDLSPSEALVRKNGEEVILPVEEIMPGDVVITRPGERIAVDGNVLSGYSTVNQAPVTGESLPAEKSEGSEVFAGSYNEEGVLEIEVTKTVQETTLAKIISMVEEAQASRAPSQQFVDVFASYYTPVVIGLAAVIAIVPPLFLGLEVKPWVEKALILLVISCPCALVISTPVSIVSAIGGAAKRGALIKGGAYLEETGRLNVIAFDKTGTITSGNLEVTGVQPFNGYKEGEVLNIAAALEKHSQHPLARSVVDYAVKCGINPPPAGNIYSLTGKGVKALIDDKTYYAGSMRLFEELQVDMKEASRLLGDVQKNGRTGIIIGTGQEIIGIIEVSDRLRSGVSDVLNSLRSLGITKTVMLTGDNSGTALATARRAGVDEFRSNLLPEDKLNIIKELQSWNNKVGMVGDGVNDAPALAASDTGIAMGGAGSDTALETSDITLMSDDLSKLPYVIGLSRRALRVLKQNIAFAVLVKLVFIAGTVAGVTNLWMAVFADTGAALIVIFNGLRLVGFKEDKVFSGSQTGVLKHGASFRKRTAE